METQDVKRSFFAYSVLSPCLLSLSPEPLYFSVPNKVSPNDDPRSPDESSYPIFLPLIFLDMNILKGRDCKNC